MRKNEQDVYFGPSNKSVCLENSAGRNKMPRIRLARPRVIVCVLALLLLMLSAFVSLTAVKNVYAQSDCFILCPPTPTPRPSSSPTPRPSPSPTPRPTPSPTAVATLTPTPSPTAVATLTPTANARVSPTAAVASTKVVQTPGGNSVNTPPITQRSSGNQTENGGFLRIVVIVGIVVPILLLSLVLGLLFVRHALLPPTGRQLPPSGARPWSRFHVPNPNNHAGSAPTSGPAFWAYDAPGGYTTDTVVNDAPGGFSTGYWPSQQIGAPGDAHMVSTGSGASSLVNADTSGFPPASGSLNPGDDSPDNPLAFSHGGTPGWPGNFKRKKHGLITRAPYYSSLATTNDNEGIS